jgi:hypothetical protein
MRAIARSASATADPAPWDAPPFPALTRRRLSSVARPVLLAAPA